MNNLTRLALGLTSIFFILVIALSFSGSLTFGYGLGDLFYLMTIGVWVLIILGVYRFTKKIDFSKRKEFAILIIVVLLCSVYYTARLFTIDRGSEFRWDGHILLSSAKADHVKKANEEFNNELKRLDSLTSGNPKDFKSFYDKGLLFRHHSEWEKSITEYEKAIKVNPNYFDAYFECAYSYSNINQYNKAVEYYQKAADIDTSNQRVREIIKNLKSYHNL